VKPQPVDVERFCYAEVVGRQMRNRALQWFLVRNCDGCRETTSGATS
jgi:hypothetical protein